MSLKSKKYQNLKENNLENLAQDLLQIIQNYFIKNRNKNNFIVFLNGDLGAGKTTFTKHFAKVIGIQENIISPTFVLRKDYVLKKDNQKYILIHIDGYRFEKQEEAKVLNLNFELENVLTKNEKNKKIILIEWADKFKDYLNLKANLEINISHKSKLVRNFSFLFCDTI